MSVSAFVRMVAIIALGIRSSKANGADLKNGRAAVRSLTARSQMYDPIPQF